jgi:HEAT repeat protein
MDRSNGKLMRLPVVITLTLLLVATSPVWAAGSAPEDPTYGGHTMAQLDAMIRDADPKQRVAAVTALRAVGADALPVFLWALNDEDPGVRMAALKAIARLGAASEKATATLAAILLSDPVPAVRTQTIHTLSQMGPYAIDAVPALRKLQREADITIRVNVSQALDRILARTGP